MKKKLNKIKPIAIPLLFILACISFYYLDSKLLGSILIIIYLIYSIREFILIKNTESSEDDLKISIIEAVNNNIFNLVYPLAIITENGDITWSNKKFKQNFKDDCEGANIVSVVRELELDSMIKEYTNFNQRLKIDEKTYKIYSEKLDTSNIKTKKELYIVYFNDITKIKNNDSTKQGIMLIEADNLVEVLEATNESDRPMLVAEVEKAINAYAQKIKAMIVKYDSNKYALSVLDKYIDEEIQNKFAILDDISNIDRGNKLEVTLSIGVGRGGLTPQENHNFATTAKELALGRGGDQVVVKNNDKINFFGGNTREIEKRTRVRARVIAHALKELLYESSNVFIMGHTNPDMDCFGAAVGISSVVKQLGKKCSIILNNDTVAIEYFLNKLKADEKYNNLFTTVEEAKKNINEKSLLIIVDVHNKGYILNKEILEKTNRKIIIDHHRRSPDIIEGALLNYIEVYASSTSEMVTELIQYMVKKPTLTKLESEGLLAGIFMDTKGFSFKAGVRTFDAASFLRDSGADTIEVKKMFTEDLNHYLLIADTIKSAVVDNQVAIAVAPERLKESYMVARIADELLGISGIEVSFVLAKINDDIIISARSMGDVNVQIVLEAIGGGGHMNIAGAKINNTSIEEAIEQLNESIKKHLRVGE